MERSYITAGFFRYTMTRRYERQKQQEALQQVRPPLCLSMAAGAKHEWRMEQLQASGQGLCMCPCESCLTAFPPAPPPKLTPCAPVAPSRYPAQALNKGQQPKGKMGQLAEDSGNLMRNITGRNNSVRQQGSGGLPALQRRLRRGAALGLWAACCIASTL